MLFVREDNFRHPLHLGGQRKILLYRKARSWRRYPFHEIDRFYEMFLFSFFPVDAVAESLFGKVLGKFVKILLPFGSFPNGMAFAAPFQITDRRHLRAGLEDLVATVRHYAVMTCPAIVTFHIVGGLYPSFTSLH